jgi:hypothetical protein
LAENQRLAMQQHNQDHTTGTSGNEYESTSAALAAHEYGAARFYSRFGQGAGV